MEELTIAVVSEQPLDEKDKQFVEDIYARLELFEQACRPFHEEAATAREIVRLRDPHQDKADAKEKTLQLQTLKSTINNCVADQMQNMPEGRLTPETPDKEEAVMDLQDLLHHIIYNVNAYDALHRRRAEDFYTPGTAITQIVWDPDMSNGKGDIALIRWPVEAFLWDNQTDSLQDARALIKVSWHPLSWYAEHYPDKAAYVNAEEGSHNNVGMTPSQQEKINDDEPRAMLLEYWYRTYNASTRKHSINVAYCAGGALLEHHTNVYAHGMYPFVIDVHSTIEGSMVGEGLVTELAPMMRYINRYARYIDTNLRMSSKGRMIVRKNSGIDRDALADWSQDLIEGSSVTQGEDWNWVQSAPFNGMIANQMLQLQNDLKQDSGANQFTRGETTAGIVSGKALTALQTAGGKVQQLRTGVLNIGFKQMIEQILWLMSEFYDDKRVFLVTGRNGQLREVALNAKKFFGHRSKGAVAPPPYNVQVEIVSRDPARIDSMNNLFMQAYTMAAQAQQYFPLSALFRMMNVEGKDRLLPVIEANETHQQKMQQLQQTNEQLMQQLAQMQKENDNLRQTSTQMTNALASVGASSGKGFTPQAAGMKAAQAGGGPGTTAHLVNQARESIMPARPINRLTE